MSSRRITVVRLVWIGAIACHDPGFFIDFDHVQMANTVGAARPHQVFFDPNIRHRFGEH